MSEVRDVLTGVVAERESSFGDPVKDLRTGRTFNAEIETIMDIESNMLLGRDARESVIFHVRDRQAAACIRQGDILAALLGEFTVLRRTDNPASPQVDFGAMKVVEEDQ